MKKSRIKDVNPLLEDDRVSSFVFDSSNDSVAQYGPELGRVLYATHVADCGHGTTACLYMVPEKGIDAWYYLEQVAYDYADYLDRIAQEEYR